MSLFKRLFRNEKDNDWYQGSFGDLSKDKISRPNELSNKLLADRIIMIGTPIDDAVAQTVLAQMIYLESESSDKNINLYLNSPGGSITASFAIYDTIKSLKPEITTICLGQAGGTTAILLAAGAKGKRFIQPSSCIVINRPQMPADNLQDPIAAQKELARIKDLIGKTIADETNLHPERVFALMRKDTILSAEEAVEYGFADEILKK
jgi:ATP-dependent Clp protease protease subunit